MILYKWWKKGPRAVYFAFYSYFISCSHQISQSWRSSQGPPWGCSLAGSCLHWGKCLRGRRAAGSRCWDPESPAWRCGGHPQSERRLGRDACGRASPQSQDQLGPDLETETGSVNNRLTNHLLINWTEQDVLSIIIMSRMLCLPVIRPTLLAAWLPANPATWAPRL